MYYIPGVKVNATYISVFCLLDPHFYQPMVIIILMLHERYTPNGLKKSVICVLAPEFLTGNCGIPGCPLLNAKIYQILLHTNKQKWKSLRAPVRLPKQALGCDVVAFDLVAKCRRFKVVIVRMLSKVS